MHHAFLSAVECVDGVDGLPGQRAVRPVRRRRAVPEPLSGGGADTGAGFRRTGRSVPRTGGAGAGEGYPRHGGGGGAGRLFILRGVRRLRPGAAAGELQHAGGGNGAEHQPAVPVRQL